VPPSGSEEGPSGCGRRLPSSPKWVNRVMPGLAQPASRPPSAGSFGPQGPRDPTTRRNPGALRCSRLRRTSLQAVPAAPAGGVHAARNVQSTSPSSWSQIRPISQSRTVQPYRLPGRSRDEEP
jgi:hypothetical protein